MTLASASRRMFWNVREMPLRATLCAGASVMSVDLKCMVPDDTVKTPVMRFISVVFPAPLGPMSPVTRPGGTSMVTSDTAATPPKCFETLLMVRLVTGSLPCRFGRQDVADACTATLYPQTRAA